VKIDFPVDAVIGDVKAALANSSNAILVAEPGAGKTTRVPLALLDAPWLGGRKIVMLEPRRLAARSSAKRMADTLGQSIGETVGYTVRLDRKVTGKTRIEVVTEGILTRRLQQDPELKDVGLLIFDEFHERNLDGDLALALALDVQRGLRDDLRLLVMSATLDTALLSGHLGDAPVIAAKGRMFPVDVVHLERPQKFTFIADVTRGILRAVRDVTGSVLVFLPGEGEIRRVAEALLKADLPGQVDVRPLFGAMDLAAQDAAIAPCTDGMRKIVLATTIAETSLTIEGIEAVVDAGLKRAPRFDPASGMTALETVRISQASAEQRKGRAGRTGPGRCYRLWPEAEMRALVHHDDPEIRIADLAQLVLEIGQWGVTTAQGLPWLEAPPLAAFGQAQDLLRQLGALDDDNAITAHGKEMARLPLHPRLSHMVIASRNLGCGRTAATLAAMISERDGLPRDASVDVEVRLLQLRGAARDRIQQAARQIRDMLNLPPDTAEISAGVMLGFAYPDRIAQRRGAGGRFRMANGSGAQLPAHDHLAREDFIAVGLLDNSAADAKVFLAGALTRAEIDRHFSNLIERHSSVAWDAKAQAVSATQSLRMGSLILEERALAGAGPAALAAAMGEGVKAMGLACLPWTEAAQSLRTRIMFLRRAMAELDWPDFSDTGLTATMDDWLLPYVAGMTKRSDLARLELQQMLRGLVPLHLVARLDQLAPVRMMVPSGGHYKIDYDGDGDPVLRVRLQELFGLKTAPQIADGRVRLKIELLSPAGRVLAVTQSLETFWVNAYPDVRKDMRGRYPKHNWPEDPLTAEASAPRRPR
jgi:ATP-dependent helicase HrpB